MKTAYQNDDISSVLTFADEIDLPSLIPPSSSTNSLSVILTDHNSLASNYSFLNPYVTGIIDHHSDYHHHPTANPRIISVVGSCTSLIVNEWQKAIISSQQQPTSTAEALSTYLDPSFATLLLSPILIDTINLNPSFYRATPEDIQAVSFLLPHLHHQSLETAQPYLTSFFTALQKAKHQISSLPTHSLLIKDYKQWSFQSKTGKSITVGISSVMFPLRGQNGWIAREGGADVDAGARAIIKTASIFSQHRNLDLLIIMTAFDHGPESADVNLQGFQREFIPIFNPTFLESKRDEAHRIAQDLEQSELKIVKFQEVNQVSLYVQNNIKFSRKQVQPIVQDLCESL